MAAKVCLQCQRSFQPAPGSRALCCEACASEQTIPGAPAPLSQLGTIAEQPEVAVKGNAAPAAGAGVQPKNAKGPLGPYTVVNELGRGAMGQVLKAWDDGLQREVAVKVLLPGHAADANLRERFLSEARITGQLEHPGIAPVYYLGQAAERGAFFSMKLVSGRTLNDVLKAWHANDPAAKKEFSLARLLGIFERVVETVGYAHAHGVLHRDLKPANIMVGTYGEVWVLDWGLAKQLEAPAEDLGKEKKGTRTIDVRDSQLTMDGTIVGTPAYMPPEQATGGALDARSDLFSLGAILYQILTGHAPYDAGSATNAVERAANSEFKPVRKAGAAGRRAPPALAAITHKCMAHDPGKRYASAQALLRDLRAYAAGEAISAMPDDFTARITRFARRHRRTLALGVPAALLLLMATTAVSVVIWRKDRQTQEANARSMAAELEKERALSASAQKARTRMEAFEIYSRAADLAGRNIRRLEAVKLLEQALQTDPEFVEAQYLYAEMLRLTGTPEHAAEAFLKANTLSRKLNGRPHLQALLGAAFAYDVAGLYNKAEDVFKLAEAVSATDPLALVGKVFTLAHNRKLGEARAVAQEALKQGSDYWECHYARGYAELECGKEGLIEPRAAQREALKHAQAAQWLAPTQAEIYNLLAMTHGFQNDPAGFEEGLRMLDHAVALEPNNPARYALRAMARMKQDPAGAEKDYETAVKKNLAPLLTTMYQIRRAQAQGRFEDAFRLMSDIITKGRNWPPLVIMWIHSGLRLKKWNEIKPVFEQLTREHPEYSEVYAIRAVLLVIEGKVKEGAAEIEKGLKVAPYNPQLLQLKQQLAERNK